MTTHTKLNQSSVHTARRRGVAMLLVIISLGMATILAVSYVSSRDNSVMISRNVTAGAESRWAAAAALEISVAVLETDTSWRTRHTNGKLLDDYAIGNADVDVDIIDADTGLPPTDTTAEVVLRATATSNGISQEATARASVLSGDGEAVEVDLREFAIFSAGQIAMANDATITVWPMAPGSKRRIAIGTQATGSDSILMQDNALSVDTTIFHPPGASAMYVNDGSTEPSNFQVWETPGVVPMPAAPTAPLATGLFLGNLDVTTPQLPVLIDVNLGDVKISNVAVTLGDGVKYHVRDHLTLDGGSFNVGGDTTIVVAGDLKMSNGASIEIEDDASLTIFVGGMLEVDDSYIGDVRADAGVRDNSGNAPYMKPDRVTVYGGPLPGNDWIMKNNSVIKGHIYTPQRRLILDNDSALYGRMTAGSVEIKSNAALFYDPKLNSGNGYTNPLSAVCQDTTLWVAMYALNSLNEADLQLVADTVDMVLFSQNQEIQGDDFLEDIAEVATPAGQPTPREVEVSVSLTSWGAALGSNEFGVAASTGTSPASAPAVNAAGEAAGDDDPKPWSGWNWGWGGWDDDDDNSADG